MILDIDKSEVRILKNALSDKSWEIYENNTSYSKKNKINLLKKLASIENKLIQECFEEGFYTKTTGKSSCWWMWTTTDENHTKTKLWKERNWQF